jgi:hypothetical protein
VLSNSGCSFDDRTVGSCLLDKNNYSGCDNVAFTRSPQKGKSLIKIKRNPQQNI